MDTRIQLHIQLADTNTQTPRARRRPCSRPSPALMTSARISNRVSPTADGHLPWINRFDKHVHDSIGHVLMLCFHTIKHMQSIHLMHFPTIHRFDDQFMVSLGMFGIARERVNHSIGFLHMQRSVARRHMQRSVARVPTTSRSTARGCAGNQGFHHSQALRAGHVRKLSEESLV